MAERISDAASRQLAPPSGFDGRETPRAERERERVAEPPADVDRASQAAAERRRGDREAPTIAEVERDRGRGLRVDILA
ncbi:MAG: hypothetical protein HYY13_11910 [Nitrospirae bacterium]|nr:hypothetical protein [Nitrospirota bacterium]